MFGQPQISKERLGANCAKGQGFYIPNLSSHSLENILRYILKFQFSKTKTKNGWGSDIFIILLKVTQFVRVEPGLKPERGSLHSPLRYWVGVSLFSFASHYHTDSIKEPSRRKAVISLSLSLMDCICLPSTTECLVRCSANVRACRQHRFPGAANGAGVRSEADLWGGPRCRRAARWWGGTLVCALTRRHFPLPSPLPLSIPHLSPLDFSSGPLGASLAAGLTALGGAGSRFSELLSICAQNLVPGRLEPGGHWRQAAAKRCLRTVDPDPPPHPLPSFIAPSFFPAPRLRLAIKGGSAGPEKRRVSAPWRAPACACCPSWAPPCCCYLCWAP